MGRKSRLKKERKFLKCTGRGELKFSEGVLNMTHKGKGPVYKFFQEEAHAEALCKGYVWLSTLETCRAYENKQRGDPSEAIHTCYYDYLTGGSSDADFVSAASRMGIKIDDGCHNLTFENPSHEVILPDAFVLCTTNEFIPAELSEDFGDYCVEISNPNEFFKRVSLALHDDIGMQRGAMGPVQYMSRDYHGTDETPRPIGFIKPESYSAQKEFRFLWIPQDENNIKPRGLRCQEITELCKRIT